MPEWALQLISAVGMGIGVYAGIRADIAALHVKADAARQAADLANRRIDGLMDRAR